MNKNILYIFIALFISAVGCTDYEEPFAEYKTSKYDLSEGEEGSVQRDIYNFYNDYNCLLLLESDSSDYRYNFEHPNAVKIINSDKQYHKAGISFLNEVWLDSYTEEFKKKNLPFSIILCDKIINSNNIEVDAYASHGFVAIAGINENLESMTSERKGQICKNINYAFWASNMYESRKELALPNSFYAVSKMYYGQVGFMWEEDIYALGMLCTEYVRPSIDRDGVDFIKFIILESQDYINTMNSTYPKIKEKYDILKNHFADTYGIDILDFTK